MHVSVAIFLWSRNTGGTGTKRKLDQKERLRQGRGELSPINGLGQGQMEFLFEMVFGNSFANLITSSTFLPSSTYSIWPLEAK